MLLLCSKKLISRLSALNHTELKLFQTLILIMIIILPIAGNPFYNSPLVFGLLLSGFVVKPIYKINCDRILNMVKFMKILNKDRVPHLFYCFFRLLQTRWDTSMACIKAAWWGVELGKKCSFHGPVSFKRYPSSLINISNSCRFKSAPGSNRIGINRPCMITTLKPGAEIHIGSGCGFSGQ